MASSFHLELRDISKRFGQIAALDHASLAFQGGEIHGLCGHNGAGKSTLMKVIMGLVTPDAGEVLLDGEVVRLHTSAAAHRVGLTIIDQELGLVPALTVEENLFLGNIGEPFVTRRRRRRRRALELLHQVGLEDVDPRATLGSLLPGQRKLVELAHVVSHNARLMILDEPTASLSHDEARRVFAAARAVAERGASVIFVSHRLDEVFELCQRITVMRDGQVVASKPTEELDRPTLVNLMVGDVGGTRNEEDQAVRGGRKVTISGLTIPPRVGDLSLEIPPGKIVGLAGTTSSGASDVLRGIGGLEEVSDGTLEIDGVRVTLRGGPLRRGRHGIHYVTNDRKGEGLFLDHSIEANITAGRLTELGSFGFLARGKRRRAAHELAKELRVRSSGVTQAVGELSGGNQQKVLIGRCVGLKGSQLLLLDDPTRGVDVGGRSEIHELVRVAAADGNAILFVSTELEELFDLADIIVTIHNGQIVSVSERAEVEARQVLAEMTYSAEERVP